MLLALPKGLVDPGENPEQTAIREVLEETGIDSGCGDKAGRHRSMFTCVPGATKSAFSRLSASICSDMNLARSTKSLPEMRIEVKRALWIALEDAAKKLAYRGEKDMVRRAEDYLKAHPEL